ncbi:MAG: hypothetical protein GY852_11495 [bacterium]|nr:hypothetical protein [bacterium]
MGITRRQLLVGAAAFGAAKLIPPVALGDDLNPENNVFVVGDLHLTNEEKPREKVSMLVSALKHLAEGKEGFHLIFNGDMVEFPNLAETCKNGGWQWEEFARLYLSVRELGFVPHLNFGNHDGSEHFAWEVLRGTVPPEYIGNSSFMVGRTKFILLSGMHPEKLDSGFLDSELGINRDKQMIVASHFPPDKLTWIRDKFGKQPGYNLWVKKEIIKMITEANASVLCSHSHSPFAGIYKSRGIEKNIMVVGTPSVTHALPYLGTEFRPPQVLGITVIDTRSFVRGTRFFNGKKAFRPARLRVESRKGTFKPLPIIMRY